jgi:predicted deacylase
VKFDALVETLLQPNVYVIISGLHGDEPAGNVAANYFKNLSNVYIFSNLNNTNKRRLDGKDPNRHFDTKDKDSFQNKLLAKIEKINPTLVISLHEDDEVDGVYAYCHPAIKDKIMSALSKSEIPLAPIAHGDATEGGVITHSSQPYKGTLERALKRRSIPYCTLETPSATENIEKRTKTLIAIVSDLINRQ